MILYLLLVFKLWDLHFGSYWSCTVENEQGRNHGIDIGGVQMWALPQIFFFKFSRGSDRKNKQAINEWIEAYQWSGKCGNSLVCDSSSSLFSLFSGYHASYLAVILSHLNVIFFHIYSRIAAVFLTMALLFRCLLAYRLKKRRMFALLSFSSYLHLI